MAKKMILFLSILILFFSILFYATTKNKKDTSLVTFITMSTLKEKLENKDSFVLILSQDGCSHCEAYLKTVDKVISKYNVTIYDLNLSKLNNAQKNELSSLFSISGTPTTVFITEGEEKTSLNRIVGELEKDKLTQKLKNLGYIKE